MKNEKNIAVNRRKLLKTVAAGGGAIVAGKTLPENWSRPVVDSVLLPAHAQTSATTFSGTTVAAISSDSMMAKAMKAFVPHANAETTLTIDFYMSWCITPVGPNAVDVYFLMVPTGTAAFAELWSGTNITTNGGSVTLTLSDACTNAEASASDWMNKYGLIKDSQASHETADFSCDGTTAGSSFNIELTDHGIEYDGTLVSGFCGAKAAYCPDL